MADLPNRRNLTWMVLVGIVVAVVIVALLVLGVGGDDSDDVGAPADPTTTATPSAPATEVDPDTFCAAFRVFADSQAQYVADTTNPVTEQALIDSADTVLGLGQPIGLSPGGYVSLKELVDSSLSQEGDPTEIPTDEVPSDNAALMSYLETSCPA